MEPYSLFNRFWKRKFPLEGNFPLRYFWTLSLTSSWCPVLCLFHGKSFLIPVLKHWFFFSPSWSLLDQWTFWPQANRKQLKYLIIDKSYSGSRVPKEFGRRNGKFCRFISSEGSAHLLHSSGALVTEQLLTVLDGFFFNLIVPWLKVSK